MEVKLNLQTKIYLIAYIQCVYIFSATAQNCDSLLSKELKDEIQGYQATANKIFEAIFNGPFKGRSFKTLGVFVDEFGSRFTGTKALEKSLDWGIQKFKDDKLDNVQEEEVKVMYWKRGKETAKLLSPREKTLNILGLGLSISTPPEGIIAQAIVVKTFDELEARKSEVAGKILVYNQEWIDYPKTIIYRNKGPVEASKLGAVACLVRSVATFSINTPHTGQVRYKPGVKDIPVASVTQEDAEFLYRLDKAKKNITIHFTMEAQLKNDVISRNIWGDLTGKEKPKNVVITSCHVDSWDVGDGAMDDGGGCIVSLETLNLLNHLGLKPRRTMRNIWFTSEEVSIIGSEAYVKKHDSEMSNIDMVTELDHGVFQPTGFEYAGSDKGACIVKEVLNLLKGKLPNATALDHLEATTADTGPFMPYGVPSLLLNSDLHKYMYYHHTEGDNLNVYTPEDLDACLAAWTVATYVIADLSVDIPRK